MRVLACLRRSWTAASRRLGQKILLETRIVQVIDEFSLNHRSFAGPGPGPTIATSLGRCTVCAAGAGVLGEGRETPGKSPGRLGFVGSVEVGGLAPGTG